MWWFDLLLQFKWSNCIWNQNMLDQTTQLYICHDARLNMHVMIWSTTTISMIQLHMESKCVGSNGPIVYMSRLCKNLICMWWFDLLLQFKWSNCIWNQNMLDQMSQLYICHNYARLNMHVMIRSSIWNQNVLDQTARLYICHDYARLNMHVMIRSTSTI